MLELNNPPFTTAPVQPAQTVEPHEDHGRSGRCESSVTLMLQIVRFLGQEERHLKQDRSLQGIREIPVRRDSLWPVLEAGKGMRPSAATCTASTDAVGRTGVGRGDVIQRRVVMRVMRSSVVMAVMMSMGGCRAVVVRVLRIVDVFGLRRMLVCRCILDPVGHAAARRAFDAEMGMATCRVEHAEWI